MFNSKHVRTTEQWSDIKTLLADKLNLSKDYTFYEDEYIHILYKDVDIISFGDNFIKETLLNEKNIKIKNQDELFDKLKELIPMNTYLAKICIDNAKHCKDALSTLGYSMLLKGNTWTLNDKGIVIYITVRNKFFDVMMAGMDNGSYDSIDEVVELIKEFNFED